MGRNRKKHKKKQKEKVINYSVNNNITEVSKIAISESDKKIVNRNVNWSNMKVMTTGRERRGPIYV